MQARAMRLSCKHCGKKGKVGAVLRTSRLGGSDEVAAGEGKMDRFLLNGRPVLDARSMCDPEEFGGETRLDYYDVVASQARESQIADASPADEVTCSRLHPLP